MKIKDRVFEKQTKEVTVMVSDDVYGCDECQKEIGYNDAKLDITVFSHQSESESHQFCSWACFAKFIPKAKSDHFIDLPFLQFDEEYKNTGCSVNDFLNILKPINA